MIFSVFISLLSLSQNPAEFRIVFSDCHIETISIVSTQGQYVLLQGANNKRVCEVGDKIGESLYQIISIQEDRVWLKSSQDFVLLKKEISGDTTCNHFVKNELDDPTFRQVRENWEKRR